MIAVGVKTQIWNNNLKSICLLLTFPFLLLIMFWAVVLTYKSASATDYYPLNQAAIDAATFTVYNAHWFWIAAFVWFWVAYFVNHKIIARATKSNGITRKDYPKLYNMLENMCIARGITPPQLALSETTALNAFASGLNEKQYTITLTRGLIDTLDDDELEAVIAHELTHIQNKDVRLLVISIIFVGIISFVFELVARGMLRSPAPFRHGSLPQGRSSEGKGAGIAIFVALLAMAVAYAMALLIRFAISRKREFMADAGAVELTKNPTALISALRKISGHSLIDGAPEEVLQMCIDNPKDLFFIFRTHPSVEQRIQALKMMGGQDLTEQTL